MYSATPIPIESPSPGVVANLYLGGDPAGPSLIVQQDQASPDGNGTFGPQGSAFHKFSLNDLGHVAFTNTLAGVTDGANSGLFLSDGTANGLSALAREGQALPGGGTLASLSFREPQINNAGQVLIQASTAINDNSEDNLETLFLRDGTADGFAPLFRVGQLNSLDQLITGLHGAKLNDDGQVAFLASTIDATNPQSTLAYFVFDPDHGLLELARIGDDLQGSPINNLFLLYNDFGFNEEGQLAFRFALEDGTEGIALATIIDTLLGDYNNNGIVDAADYTVWQDSFGSTTDLAADGNGNGMIDAADYTVWQDNFGSTNASTSTLSIIPEPASLTVLGVLGAGLIGRRRER
uniref:DUF7453 family protein n=1 Tax=Algisphaera agarilytica TaxID=1385975 RepID=UPI0036F38C80